jgi:simple sugar transport system ATP-binding protein
MLELCGVSKTFGAFTALDGVDLRVDGGEIVGLLGENGAGKSTLLGIVSGNLAPTRGVLHWQGQPIRLASPRDATARGIGIVHQHFQLVPGFTVAENLALAAPRARFVYSEKEWSARIAAWARELDWKVDPSRRVEELGVGERQRIEILKALFVHEDLASDASERASTHTAKLLLLDEPTSNLTPAEVADLFDVLRRLKAGGCGLVFVSHKLNEVLAFCDRVTVLRHGKVVGERAIEETDADDLAELMVGRALSRQGDGEARRHGDNGAVLEIKNVSCGTLRDFSLKIEGGEIVGLAGVDGNGQAELVEVLSGLKTPHSGRVRHSSVAVIPPDRRHVGLIPSLSLTENMALHSALRAQCRKFLRFDWARARASTRELMKKFDVRAPQAQENAPASQLSGGNQQKLVIARALSFPHSVVVAADPTRGLDVAATQFVHQQLKNAAQEGAGVLLISTDLDEILALSDRIGVLYEGRLLPNAELLPRTASREEIGKLMGGFSQTRRRGDEETRRSAA